MKVKGSGLPVLSFPPLPSPEPSAAPDLPIAACSLSMEGMAQMSALM